MFRPALDEFGQAVILVKDILLASLPPPSSPFVQADLADRDFTAERGQAVVIISSGAVDPLAEERNEKERREAEERHRHRLKLPRRPKWTAETTAEELDLQVCKRPGEGGGLRS